MLTDYLKQYLSPDLGICGTFSSGSVFPEQLKWPHPIQMITLFPLAVCHCLGELIYSFCMSSKEKALFGSEWPISLWPRCAVTLSLLQHILPPPPRPMTHAVYQKELVWKLIPHTVQYSEDTPVSIRSSLSALPWHPSWAWQFPRL